MAGSNCNEIANARETPKALKQIESEFISGFIKTMDGEKDPRNLLLAFSLVKLIIGEFDISQHVEV